MTTKITSWFCLMAMAFSCLAAEGKWLFGGKIETTDTPQFLDFQYLTAEDEAISGRCQPWNYQKKAAATYAVNASGSLPADQMLEQGIHCQDTSITLKTSNGSKKLRLWLGTWFSGIGRKVASADAASISCQGQTILEHKLTPTFIYQHYWLKGEDYVFSQKDDIWGRIVFPVLDEITIDTEAVNGEITLELKNILLTAVVITENQAELTALADKIAAERQKEFRERYPWQQPADEELPPLPAEYQQRPFLLWQTYGTVPIHPWSRPKLTELSDNIRVFAAQGEQEMFRFAILPQQDLAAVTVKVGDFRHSDGTSISTAENADLWRERYKARGSEGTAGKITDLTRLDPTSYVLQSMAPQDCEAGTPRVFLLDMRVPGTAAAGDYFAPLTFYSAGKVISEARLQLKVLPYRLEYEGSAAFNFQLLGYTQWPDDVPGNNLDRRQKYLDFLAFQRKYHFNANYVVPFARFGHLEGELGERVFRQTPQEKENFDFTFQSLQKFGNLDFLILTYHTFNWNIGSGLYVGYPFQYYKPDDDAEKRARTRREVISVLRQFDTLVKEHNYPPLRWYVSGEPDNFGLPGVQAAVEMAEICQEAGVTSFVTINGGFAKKLCPPVYDFLSANSGAGIDQELVDAVKKHGGQFGAHNTGDTRFQAGWHFWRMHGFAKHQETVFYIKFNGPRILLPWNYNTCLVYPAPDGGLRPTLRLLNYRDGRDDYLYMYTLEKAIERAKVRGQQDSQAVREAEAFLAEMEEYIYLDPRMYHAKKADAIEGTAEIKSSEWNAVSFERYRWLTAALTMAVEEKK